MEIIYNYSDIYDLLKNKNIKYRIGETCRWRTKVIEIPSINSKFNEIRFYLRDCEIDNNNKIISIPIQFFHDGKNGRFCEEWVGDLNMSTHMISRFNKILSFDEFVDRYNLK